jgi:hypothetical protein
MQNPHISHRAIILFPRLALLDGFTLTEFGNSLLLAALASCKTTFRAITRFSADGGHFARDVSCRVLFG